MTSSSISPYALTSNDNPGNLLTHTQLKGPNFEEWVKAIKVSLRAKKKMGFITGTIKQPTNDSEEIEDWWTVNSMIISWIFNTIEPSLRSTISYRETTKELWDDIQQRFLVRNGARIHQLKTEVANCKEGSDSIMSFYGRIKKLWDDLNDYDQMPLCTCNECNCDINAKLTKRSEEEKVHQFLMGLDDTHYNTIRSNIIASDPLPNMNNIYSKITKQEQVRVMTQGGGERHEAMSLATKKSRGGSGRRGAQVGRVGQLAKVNAAQINRPISSTNTIRDADKVGLEDLKSEDWEILKSLWNNHKSTSTNRLTGKKSFQWIFDTGASHHMTGDIGLLCECRDINPCPVIMPNGEKVLATKEGSIKLGQLFLKGVLFVNALDCHLVSVSKLLGDTNYILKFTDRMCVVKDRISKMLIGVGKEQGGLYLVQDMLLARTK
ncbi:uncharacterized protein LOC127259834 [Andrographis paniculata]|uniref:uncharacterized protein LOC127259834 n=1 Tax=Andrographis paniculata TaxID=175694 RepID=UPI0021E78200|nr:uncharacterized protein LOC127259834 [Andrographis paniculata]